jgi:(p)ppGpp synthase/HD superfamily hydrolase
VLHDVLEDTPATPEDLAEAGVKPEVVEAVRLLSKPEPMHYTEYILRLAQHPIAREVKLADLSDNYRLDRVAYRESHAEEDRQRIQRYILAFQFLQGTLPESAFRARMQEIA